jgi:hypothetical protein
MPYTPAAPSFFSGGLVPKSPPPKLAIEINVIEKYVEDLQTN